MFAFFLKKKQREKAKTNMNSKGRAFPTLAFWWMHRVYLLVCLFFLKGQTYPSG